MRVLQNQQASHQPDRQRRMAVAVGVDLAEPPIEEGPVDLAGQPHQRVAHVNDLLQRRPEQVRLPVIPRVCIGSENAIMAYA